MSPPTRATSLPSPQLGEWACLAAVYDEPAHGWSVAARLRPDGDLGRIWHVSRPLTYRSIDQLQRRGWLDVAGVEPGEGGPVRTMVVANRSGRAALRRWLRSPVVHLRDLRSELLLKLVLADTNHVDVTAMLAAQRDLVDDRVAALVERADASGDVVDRWRVEAARGAQRFLALTGADRGG